MYLGIESNPVSKKDGLLLCYGHASRLLSKTEHKYPAHKLQFLALKWTIMEQFHEYLYGNTSVIYTDALSYQSGKMNVDVDALSCILRAKHNHHIEAHSVHALISQVVQGTILIETYSCNIWVTDTLDMQKDLKAMLLKDWIIAQSKDPVIREIKYLISNKQAEGA